MLGWILPDIFTRVSPMPKKHSIHALEMGPMQNFIYLIKDEDSGRAAIVDPAWDVPSIDHLAQQLNTRITDVLLTHSHHDHINGIAELLHRHDAELHILREEFRFWESSEFQPTLHTGGDIISLGNTQIEVLHTPGHTPGSACYYIGDDLITGDTLFVFGCGRCDMHGGDPEQMLNTLKNMQEKLPRGTLIHPGHNYATQPTATMQEQSEGNPFMHFEELPAFKQYRLFDHGKVRSQPYTAISAAEIQQLYKDNA